MKFSRPRLFKFQKSISIKTQLSFLKKLEKLLNSGYPLIQAFSVMEWDEKMADLSRLVAGYLKEGLTIDEAFGKASFDEEVVTYLFFARLSGELPSVLKQCCEMMEHRVIATKKFKQTSSYPLFLLLICLFLLWFVKQSVYPAFYDLFSSSGSVSPILSYSMMAVDLLFVMIAAFVFLALSAAPVAFFLNNFTPIDAQLRFYQKIPLYRLYLKKKITFLFSLHLSALFQTGFSPKEAFQAIAAQNKQPILSFYAKQVITDLEYGTPLGNILPTLYFLESDLHSIFQKNATIQWIEKDLSTYADFLIEQMQEQIKKAAGFIQPAVFCLLGFLIVFVYLSIMLPMFQLIESV